MTGATSPDHAPRRAARRAAAARRQLRERSRQPRTRRGARWCKVLSENEKDPAALASLDRIYESQGMYENLAAILRQRLTITDDNAELVTLNLRLGRVYAEALEEIDPAIASYLAVLEHESRSRDALDALERLYFRSERWPELYGIYEKLVDVPKDDDGLADCYARMAKLAADALDDREKAVELWGRVVDIRGEDAIALSGLADLHEMAGEWKELTEVLEKQVARDARSRGAHPDLQAPRPHLGREAVARAQLARELAEGPGARPAGRRRPARDRRELQERGRVGGAVAGAAPLDPGRTARWQRYRARRAEGAVLAARRARRRHVDADAGRDRRLARGAGARRGRLPRAGGARAPVHAGGALGGGGRHPRAPRARAGEPERSRRRADAGGVAVGRQDRRRRFGGRGVRTRPPDRSGPPARVGRAGAAVSPAQELGEAGRPAAGAHRVLAGRGDAHSAARARCPRPTSSSSAIATPRS